VCWLMQQSEVWLRANSEPDCFCRRRCRPCRRVFCVCWHVRSVQDGSCRVASYALCARRCSTATQVATCGVVQCWWQLKQGCLCDSRTGADAVLFKSFESSSSSCYQKLQMTAAACGNRVGCALIVFCKALLLFCCDTVDHGALLASLLAQQIQDAHEGR
jgi:hypothetical protein